IAIDLLFNGEVTELLSGQWADSDCTTACRLGLYHCVQTRTVALRTDSDCSTAYRLGL
ncbi:uncharacterized, partial [Tachysurus ichikawai]